MKQAGPSSSAACSGQLFYVVMDEYCFGVIVDEKTQRVVSAAPYAEEFGYGRPWRWLAWYLRSNGAHVELVQRKTGPLANDERTSRRNTYHGTERTPSE